MTEEQKTRQEKANAPSEGMNWAEMMSQMCGEGEGSCINVWRSWMGRQGQSGNMEAMPWMMSRCIGTKAVADEKTVKKDTENT